jgi:hypothetical protein
LSGVDDGLVLYQLSGESLGYRVDLKLNDKVRAMPTFGKDQGFAYVIRNCVIQAQLASKPLSQRLETTAQNGHLEAQSFQGTAQLAGTLGDGDNRFELVKHIGRDTLE